MTPPPRLPIAPRGEQRCPMTETAASLRELAEQSNAWPFEEARKIVARLKKQAEGRGHLRDRLRSVRPAAHRHLRRGRAHHHGAPRLPRAHRRQGQDPADRVLRRHGRPAQGAGQHAEQGDAGAASRQAADARCPIRSARIRASASTTMRGCAPSSITSASTTSSCRRPTATSPAVSTTRCCKVLARFDKVMAIMLPSLREERAQTYSPFLPIDPAHRHRAAGAGRSRTTPRPARSPTRIRTPASR